MRIEPKDFINRINHSYKGHQECNTKNDFRQGGTVPFVVHPLWCAMMIVNDSGIPFEIKRVGYEVLLLHDVLEDTSLGLPKDVDPEVEKIIKEMTHDTWEEEQDLSGKSDIVKLLKLYDKVATLYDETIRPDTQRRKEWITLIEVLMKEVEKLYPKARILSVARGLLKDTKWF